MKEQGQAAQYITLNNYTVQRYARLGYVRCRWGGRRRWPVISLADGR